MRGKKLVAWALSAIMAVAPLSACAQQSSGGGEAGNQTEEEMNRGVESTDGEVISVEANDEGVYTVAITEKNLMEDQSLAENADEIVTADEAGVGTQDEMTRGDVDVVEEADGEDSGVADESESGQDVEATEEDEAAQDVEASEEAEPADGAEGVEPANEPGEWSLASVRREDVVVSYNVPVDVAEGEEPQHETLQAEVTDFGNDGAVRLTFKGEGRDSNTSENTYTVRFAGTDAYAVVRVAPTDNGVVIEDVDFDAQVAELGEYKPGFSVEDIALPEGTYLEDGELIVTEDAPEAVQESLLDSGFAEAEMSRANGEASGGGDEPDDSGEAKNATIEYMQKCKEIEWDYENYDAVAQYAPEVLSEIDPRAGKVAELGADAYRIFRGFYRNEWSYVAEGGLGVLKMLGLFKGGEGSSGVSNEQIMSEVQKVGLEVTDMHALTRAMNATLNETLRQAYANNLQTFDNAVISLHSNAEIVQKMLTTGAIRAAADGIEPPAEDCVAEEEYDYNYNLVEYIEKLEAAGGRKNSAFKGFTKHMENLTSNFVLVAGEVAKPAEANPVKTYDKYWNLHFNFDTQGYYLRKSYRANIEYELKRSFALMEVYYNVFDPETSFNYDEYNTELWKALNRLEQLDPGLSPSDLLQSFQGRPHYEFKHQVYCNTFSKNVYGINVDSSERAGNDVPSGLLEEYARRLHGGSLEKDLKLAGIWWDQLYGYWFQWTSDRPYERCAHGMEFNAKFNTDKQTHYVDLITPNGTIMNNVLTYNNGKQLKQYDDSKESHGHMPNIILMFEGGRYY